MVHVSFVLRVRTFRSDQLCAELLRRSPRSSRLLSTRSLILSTPLRSYARFRLSAGQARSFCTCPSLLKKKSRTDRELEEKERTSIRNSGDSDPYDFSSLSAGITECHQRLEAELKKVDAGGKGVPELLENLRINLQRNSKNSERLGDLAHMVPKAGRKLSIIIGDKAHVKSIISTIQASPTLNLQPVQDTQDPLHFTVPIPSPTKESRAMAVVRATTIGETAITGIRAARAVAQKRLRKIEIKKLARPDDLKKAHKEMEKLVEKGIADAKMVIEKQCKSMKQV